MLRGAASHGIVAGEPTGSAGNPLAFGGLVGRALRRRAGRGPAVPEVTQSGLLIPVPEAEPAVGEWRRRLDPAAKDGVPAHVTVLFPFIGVEAVDDAVAAQLQAVVAQVEPFDFSLHHVGWFGKEVMFLAPEPADLFRRLTFALVEVWPSFQPYGGVHADIVPHLTVGDHARVRDMRAAADDLAARLPIRGRATEVWLMGGRLGQPWSTVRRFPLGSKS